MAKASVPKYLYHYTKIDTLKHLFKDNGKVELRLTDYRFLNDAEEGLYLKKYLDVQSEKYKSSLSLEAQVFFDDVRHKMGNMLAESDEHFYLMSFSMLDDSMQFWRQDYANDRGICLKINTKKYAELKTSNGVSVPPFIKVKYIRLRQSVNKAFPDLKNSLENEASKIREGKTKYELYWLTNLLGDVFPYDVKNAVWKSEEEWRIQMPDKYRFRDEIHEIDSLGFPRAKMEIDNPFDEIILGPSFRDSCAVSIKKWLSDRGFDGVNVRRGDGFLNPRTTCKAGHPDCEKCIVKKDCAQCK